MNSPKHNSPNTDGSSDDSGNLTREDLSDHTTTGDPLHLIAMENRHLGYEIHDGLLQQVIGAGMLLEALRYRIKAGYKATEEDIFNISGLLQDAIQEGRQLVGRLESTLSEYPTPLQQSLQEFVQRTQSRSHRIRLHLGEVADAGHLSSKTQSHLLGIVRESVSNALRHSRGKNVWIAFTRVSTSTPSVHPMNGEYYLLEISDDGVGIIDQQDLLHSPQNHFGLSSLHFRATAIGGLLEIKSDHGKGTTVRVKLPVTNQTGTGH